MLEDDRIPRREVLGARKLGERGGDLPAAQQAGPVGVGHRAVVGTLIDRIDEEPLCLLERLVLLDQRISHVVEGAGVMGGKPQHLAHGAEGGLLLSGPVLRARQREEDRLAARVCAGRAR